MWAEESGILSRRCESWVWVFSIKVSVIKLTERYACWDSRCQATVANNKIAAHPPLLCGTSRREIHFVATSAARGHNSRFSLGSPGALTSQSTTKSSLSGVSLACTSVQTFSSNRAGPRDCGVVIILCLSCARPDTPSRDQFSQRWKPDTPDYDYRSYNEYDADIICTHLFAVLKWFSPCFAHVLPKPLRVHTSRDKEVAISFASEACQAWRANELSMRMSWNTRGRSKPREQRTIVNSFYTVKLVYIINLIIL